MLASTSQEKKKAEPKSRDIVEEIRGYAQHRGASGGSGRSNGAGSLGRRPAYWQKQAVGDGKSCGEDDEDDNFSSPEVKKSRRGEEGLR